MCAQSSESLLTILGNLVFWAVVVDVLWRAATNQLGTEKKKQDTTRSRLALPGRKKDLSFESVVILRSTPLKLVIPYSA